MEHHEFYHSRKSGPKKGQHLLNFSKIYSYNYSYDLKNTIAPCKIGLFVFPDCLVATDGYTACPSSNRSIIKRIQFITN